ncbi:MAG: hypothetical protein IPH07_37890 [Deltaproteobacteria bacterium]|nr:hypothetical protein [Deltaproteobacteria bacterium]MBP7291994.1 hypothetical protein [Nannocystaceae bacterium]
MRACDQACRHCGSRGGHARPDALTTAEALGLVHQLADLGVREVTLIGGEATTPTSAARAATSPRSPQLDTPGDSLLA